MRNKRFQKVPLSIGILFASFFIQCSGENWTLEENFRWQSLEPLGNNKGLESLHSSKTDIDFMNYVSKENNAYNRALINGGGAVSYTHQTLPTIYSV